MKQYLGACLIALAAFAAWAFVMPAYNQTSEYQTAIREREELLQSRKDIVAKVAAINKQLKDKTSDIYKLASIIPAKKSVPEIVSAVEQIATQGGIQLVSLAIINDKSTETANYSVLAVDMSLSGSYLSMLNFLNALEKNLRLIDVISIEASQNPGLEAQGTINFKMAARAYYLK